MSFPPELKYSKEHEWIRLQANCAVVGITEYAQHELGDVVFVELPEAGATVIQFVPFGTIESVKASSELFSPLTGTVKAINLQLMEHPEYVNKDPYGKGWMIEVEFTDKAQLDNLLTADGYQQSLPGH